MKRYDILPLTRLVEHFERLPGIGHKTAQRMAFQVLSYSEADAKDFANAILEAHSKVQRCEVCCNFTDQARCPICAAPQRDGKIVCVVEDPRDVMAFERTGEYHGLYHVLHGLINPMESIGPDQLTVKELLYRLANEDIEEVIMATNPTVNGEATAMYLARLIKPFGIKVTRLAYGLPVGSNLEYADEVTLSRAMDGRTQL